MSWSNRRVIAFCIFFLATIGVSRAQDAHEDRKRFLVFNSYHPGFEWSDGLLRGIITRLRTVFDRPSIVVEYLDTKRRPVAVHSQYETTLLELYRLRYSGARFDSLLCTDDAAFRFLVRHKETLLPGTPVVFCGVNDLDLSTVAGRTDITGIVEVTEYQPTIELGLRLRPNAKRLGIITDASENGRSNRRKFEALAPRFKDRLEFVYFDDKDEGIDLAAMASRVAAFNPDDLIYFVDFYLDGAGKSYEYDVAVPALVERAPCPVLYHADMYDRFGILGGVQNRSEDHGELAAELAARIVRGETPASIPIIVRSLARPILSWSVLRRYSIDPSLAPEGTYIPDRPIPFLKKNFRILSAAAAVVVILCAVIAILVALNHSRKKAENALRSILRALPVPIAVFDEHGMTVSMNEAFFHTYGYNRERTPDIPTLGERMFPDPAKRLSVKERINSALLHKDRQHGKILEGKKWGPFEIEIASDEGMARIVDLHMVSLTDSVVVAAIDETERRSESQRLTQSLAEKEILLREIHHRVKNNLQIISSLLSIQTTYAQSETTITALQEAMERIRSISAVHEQLYADENIADIALEEYAFRLIEGLRLSYNLDESKLRCDLSLREIRVSLDLAVSLGLILNELLTNTAKYAFADRTCARIDLRAELSDSLLTIEYRDDGPGLPDGFDWTCSHGLGLTLLKTLSAQLRAHGGFIEAEQGILFRIEIPRPPKGF